MTSFDGSTEITNIANGLLRARDLGQIESIESLSGGRNNRTYRIVGNAGTWLLKQYFQDTSRSRDRCASEWNWSKFCWDQGVTCLPQPLATDAEHYVSLFEFIDGRHLNPEEVAESHVRQATEFVVEVNRHRDRPSAKTLTNAAEACFSLNEHLACVDRRVERLLALPVNDELEVQLYDWLNGSLLPTWKAVVNQSPLMTNQTALSERLPTSHRCLSPSDFGFHNALMTPNGNLRFFDFEYAGWDDPAKLVCDFFWQQQLPAPRQCRPKLISSLATRESESTLEQRVSTLFPVYGIKWCCLVLNEFVIEDRRRREFARASSTGLGRRVEQFARAKRILWELQGQLE